MTQLAPQHVEVADDSAAHAGHLGAMMGGGHYTVTVVSDRFEGKNTLARHRLVYAALEEEMKQAIHALRIEAYTSEEWK